MATSRTSQNTDPLRNLGFLLRDVARLYATNFEQHAAKMNLTLAQCKVLAYLQRNEGICQARLALLTDTDPMTLGRTVERMAGEGFLERRPNADDRRKHRLYLLPPAIPVLREIWRCSDQARAKALEGLSVADRTQLMHLLEQVNFNLEAVVAGVTGEANATAPAKRRRAAGAGK